MFRRDKQFRKHDAHGVHIAACISGLAQPDGSSYDPSSFNVRQFEEQYGPGGVPDGWSMAATTPVQSPGLILALGVFTALMSLGMIFVGSLAIGSGKELGTIVLGLGAGGGALAMSVQAFRIAAKRRRWLRIQQDNPEQEK
ncbi:hypothetical protein [Arthrobacter sp. W4I7]|uniref:hypothetical protein n=1 Tax=Arthrobacter sp. W4I7 TaxID=3042296 RepID=UPI00277F5A4E|nr:hypothetical protein [Arthrobacter sp. W4I7]MDQ0690933.1 hypothetical protein [Arthrobacter sp. W4I7]